MNAEGKVLKYGDNIDTDVIIPARYLAIQDKQELASHAMEDIDQDFLKKLNAGDIVVAGKNFGCGSSREIAPIIIKLSGVGAVLAKSFGRIFYRNAINNGMLIIECDTDRIDEGDELFIDVKNRIIRKVNDPDFAMPFVLSEKEVKIISEGGLLNYIENHNSLDI